MIGSFASVFTGMRNGKMPEIEDLPFVKRRRNGAGFHYWNVKPTGNYGEDCAIGNQLARLSSIMAAYARTALVFAGGHRGGLVQRAAANPQRCQSCCE